VNAGGDGDLCLSSATVTGLFWDDVKELKEMDPNQLVVTALRLLAALSNGRKPAAADVQLLKDEFPTVVHLPMDDLCCRVIQTLSGMVSEREIDNDEGVTRLLSELRLELERIDQQILALEQPGSLDSAS
jgi:hypothetical protein